MDLWILKKWEKPMKFSAIMAIALMLGVMWWDGPNKILVLLLNFIPVYFLFEVIRNFAERLYPQVAFSCKLAVRHVLSSAHQGYDWTPEYNWEDYKLKRVWAINIWLFVILFALYCGIATLLFVNSPGIRVGDFLLNFDLERAIKICGWFLGFLAIADLGREYEFYTRRDGKLPVKVIADTVLISLMSIFTGLTLALIAQEVWK